MDEHPKLAALDKLKDAHPGVARQDHRQWLHRGQGAVRCRQVFFGLRSDIEVAHYLTELIDNAVRSELGRYKTSAGYRRFRHQDRYLANSSFTLGMVASIADKLTAMKAERDAVNNGTGRDLVVLKGAVVDAEFEKLDLTLQAVLRQSRMVSTSAYEAGSAAGASLTINPGIGEPPITRTVRKNS